MSFNLVAQTSGLFFTFGGALFGQSGLLTQFVALMRAFITRYFTFRQPVFQLFFLASKFVVGQLGQRQRVPCFGN
ncbi:hypothetical protein, partial [Thiolapillus sp.]|uniref:hypothetical protein n=1 Tax=Thiolapillus sp. TaxID=2017437 RepID=UPI003AF47240